MIICVIYLSIVDGKMNNTLNQKIIQNKCLILIKEQYPII